MKTSKADQGPGRTSRSNGGRRRTPAWPALGAIAVAWFGSAAAQQQASEQPATTLEEVVITGSRIAAPNQTSTSPIQVLTARDIETTGRNDIGDVLAQLPQVFNNSLGQDLGNRTSGLTTAGGVSTVDLRGLGPNRTLVLVDGIRLGQGSPYTAIQSPAPDIDQIPAALIDRIDVVTGGASAVYGSDAIAGVVNFIMKKNFEGIQIDAQLGENWHDNHSSFAQNAQLADGLTPLTGSIQDGRNKTVSVLGGTNIADGKGNITVFFGYLHADPVTSGDRDFGGCQLNPTFNSGGNVIGASCVGSPNSNWFEPLTGPNSHTPYSVLGSSLVPYGSAPTTPPAEFNSQPYIYMSREDERYNAGFMAHLDVNDYVKPYAQFFYMNDQTHQEIAPSGLFRDANTLIVGGYYPVNCSNPLLSAQEQQILCTPAQIAADEANPGSASSDVRIGRRNIEGGGRSSDYEHSNYRAVVGAKGNFADAWNYDAYAQYYYVNFFNSNNKYLNFQSIDNALQVTGTAQSPVCISGAPCVPYNIFQDGGVTGNQLNYLYLTGTAYGTDTLRTLHADVTGELGKYGIKLPSAHDGLAVNIGVEHRSEHVTFEPDSGELSGLLSGFGGASVPLDNGVSVDEQFVELRAPLVQDVTGIKDLLFDAGFRRSDYSTAGTVNTYKFEVQYAPIADLRFRGSYQRAIRAPSIVELFNPQLVGQIEIGADPCAPTIVNGVLVAATASLTQCERTGVTAAQYGNGGTTNIVPQGAAGQLSQLQGGNPALKPETADTYSFGVTFAPLGMRNLTGSIDYYHIKLQDTINAIPATLIMSDCLNTGDPTYCSQIVRGADGGLTGNSIGSKGYIIQTDVNIGANVVSGVDLQASYKLGLGAGWGSMAFDLNGAYLIQTTTTAQPGSPTFDCVGLFGATCQTVNPRWHHILRTMWNTPWDVTASLTWRFIGPVSLDNNSAQPGLAGAEYGTGVIDYFNARIPGYSYLDLAASWNIGERTELRAGINNLLDKDPPIVTADLVAGGAANTYETYDTLGRQIYVAFKAKF